MEVLRIGLVANVTEQLNFGADAPNGMAEDSSRGEPLGRVSKGGAVLVNLNPATLLIEGDRVEVDLETRGVLHDESRRQLVFDDTEGKPGEK